jgi:molybdate transport system substrate-binding protein
MRRVLALAGVLLLTAGCGSTSSGGDRQPLTVLAAASLTESFERIAADFEQEHSDVTVRLSFGPSDGLAGQIQNGAPTDVFASASEKWMDAVEEDPGVSHRADFARNRLTIVVPADNPAGVHGVEDLATPGVKLVLAAEGVPVGDYAREMLANAGVSDAALANVVSNEVDVKGVLAKVVSGDADAGIVYVTDITPDVASTVTAIDIPDDVNVIATYPIAVVAGASDEDMAAAFVRLVLGPGQRTLRDAGFLPA